MRGGGTSGRGGRITPGRGSGKSDSASRISGRGGMAGRGRGGYLQFRRSDRKIDRIPSVTVEADWELLDEFDLAQLLKLVANPPKVEDLKWCGHLDQYDETYEKLTTKTARPLQKIENKIFYGVTTSDDPVLQDLAAEEAGDIFATDAILSQLMAAPRSVYSWDIIIQKINGMIFLDKRDMSTFDLLTVSETAREPPSSDDSDSINHPHKLSIEATVINQNFSQQVLKDDVELRKTVREHDYIFEVILLSKFIYKQ
jgi:translation initiation factor 3 subunit D